MTDQPDPPQWVDEVRHPGLRKGLQTLCEIARQLQDQPNHPPQPSTAESP